MYKQENMDTTTVRSRRSTQPIIKAWDAVKGLDYNDKLELVTMLIDSVRPAIEQEQGDVDTMSMEQMLEGYPYKRYTKEELNAMLDEAEAEIAAGGGITDEEVWRKYDEEFALEEQEELAGL